MTINKPANDTLTLEQLLLDIHTLRGLNQNLRDHGLLSGDDLHGVPRSLFDQLPGEEQSGTTSSGVYWSKRYEGVVLFCDDPPVCEVAGSAEQPTEEEVTA